MQKIRMEVDFVLETANQHFLDEHFWMYDLNMLLDFCAEACTNRLP
jgi:hypothetical protein